MTSFQNKTSYTTKDNLYPENLVVCCVMFEVIKKSYTKFNLLFVVQLSQKCAKIIN